MFLFQTMQCIIVSRGERKKIDFLANMSDKLWPPPSSPLTDKNIKVDFFHHSNRNALKWTILKQKKGRGRPPRRDTCIQNMIYEPFISMVVLLQEHKFILQKNS